jgi:Flp pilus assembly protein TadD
MDMVSSDRIESAIAELDRRLRLDPGATGPAIDRAQFLELLGRLDEAVQAYVDVLARDPENVAALNALGLLFLSAGNREAARTLLQGAVRFGPESAAAHANLAYVAVLDEEFAAARTLYERALTLDSTLAIAHHGLAELLVRAGDNAAAEDHRALGLRYRPITLRRYRGSGPPLRLLVLGSAAFGNVATDAYFDDRVFAVASLVVDYDDPAIPLPPHDLVFNAIGEADLCPAELATAAAITTRTLAPVINRPAAVAATGRATNARRLRELTGVVTPRIACFARGLLCGPRGGELLDEHGFRFPLLIRTPGHHTGDHFSYVASAGDLAAAVAALPGDELFVIEYIDVCDAHGDAHKYRVIIVDGKLYPLHLAISARWKVHYMRADMAQSAEHRARDGAFLTDMHATLGGRAIAALERVRDVLDLDVGGIDFALAANGDVIVFEANASMIVPQPEPGAMWDYRREPVARIHAAVRSMLVTRAGVTSGSTSSILRVRAAPEPPSSHVG